MVAMAGMFISGDKTFISFGLGDDPRGGGCGNRLCSRSLPAMLSWLGDRVEKGRVPILGRKLCRRAVSPASGRV